MNTPQSISSTRAAEPVGPYPHARRVGNLLFLSGVGPRTRGSKEIPGAKVVDGRLVDYDFEAEMRSCFENVRIVLEEAGSRWEDIVDVTSYLTDLERDWPVYNRVYAEYFPAGPSQPARTTLGIAALPMGGLTPIHYEVKVVAVVEK